MNILSFDTCFDACSVAAGRGLRSLTPSISFAYEPMQKGHAERLMPMIEAVMAEVGLEFTALDRIAVAASQERGDEPEQAEGTGDHPEFLLGPLQAGLRDAQAKWDFPVLLPPRLELLQRSLDLLASRTLGAVGRAYRGRLRARHRCAAGRSLS